MADWDRASAAHLLRRAGFGAPRRDVDRALRDGPEGTVDRLLSFKPSGASYRGKPDTYRAEQWWLLRMLKTKAPLQEKMTLFWHGHFANSDGKVEDTRLMARQNALFRRFAAGNFRELLLEVSRDPAMVLFLDNVDNVKDHPNENYARELMELFSLGRADESGQPNYTQEDVREAARAFTGWTLDDRRRFLFDPEQHDDGPKTVLGLTGNLDGGDVTAHLAGRPVCARYLVRKLWTFFAYPDPETAVVDALAAVYTASDTEIAPVLRALFLRPEFQGSRARTERVGSPVEFTVGTLRTLGGASDGRALPDYTYRMGQEVFYPPNVAGWPGGLRWMTSVTRLGRFQFAWDLVAARGKSRYLRLDLKGITDGLPEDPSPADLVDHVLALVGPAAVPAAARDALIEYVDTAEDGSPGGFDPSDAYILDLKARGLAGLVLTLPESLLV